VATRRLIGASESEVEWDKQWSTWKESRGSASHRGGVGGAEAAIKVKRKRKASARFSENVSNEQVKLNKSR